jgi:hypothetical protein
MDQSWVGGSGMNKSSFSNVDVLGEGGCSRLS